jgi:hypothetical protein
MLDLTLQRTTSFTPSIIEYRHSPHNMELLLGSGMGDLSREGDRKGADHTP